MPRCRYCPLPGLFLLQCPQSCIGAFLLKQAVVYSGFDNPAGLHDQNVIGIHNSRQPVCNDQAGMMRSGFAQGGKNCLFRV